MISNSGAGATMVRRSARKLTTDRALMEMALRDLESLLAHIPRDAFGIRVEREDASGVDRLNDLRETRAALFADAGVLLNRIESEARIASPDEEISIRNLQDQVAAHDREITRRETQQALASKQTEIQPRKTTATDAQRDEPRVQNANQNRQTISGGAAPGSTRGSWGFSFFGEYAMALVHNARTKGRELDSRIANAPTTYGSEANGEDGGYAVPPDFRSTIIKKVMGEDSLLSRTYQLVTSGNSITIPVDATAPWSTGGIQGAWLAEAALKPQTKPALTQEQVRMHKYGLIVPMSDELIADAPALGSYLQTKVPEVIGFAVNNAIINGDGVGKPLGIMASGALVTVDEESSQANATVVPQNIAKMWGRMPQNNRDNAIWLINQDVEPALDLMFLQGSSGGIYPVYMPPGGLSDARYGRLYGRPVIPTEALPTLGAAGDVLLADLSEYMTVLKTAGNGGIKTDVSIHLWFDYDVTAFRFVIRIGGQPMWNTAIARRDSSNTNTLSPFIALGARVT